MTQNRPPRSNLQERDPEIYARLKAEAKAPYRGLRRFIYAGFGASGAIGGFIFLLQAIAGQNLSQILPNLALQIGVVALMVWLYRLEDKAEKKQAEKAQK
jgi:hypothetical protein